MRKAGVTEQAARIVAIAATLAAGAGESVRAQTRLTLQEAVSRALATHPSVVSAEMSVGRASSVVREAESARLPSLHATADATRFAEAMVVAPLHGFNPQMPPAFDRTLMQGSVSLDYTLFDAGRGARVDRTLALRSAAETGVQAARQALVAEVANAYLEARTASELVAVHDARVVALEREQNRAAQLFGVGRVARVVMLRADAALSAARADRVSAASRLDAAERELVRVVGLDAADVAARPLTAVVLTEEGQSVDRAAVLARAAEGSAHVAGLRHHVEAAHAQGAAARALWLPRVQLSGRFVEYASGSGHESGEWHGSAQVSYALFTGGARGAAADRAAAELGAAHADLALAVMRVANAVDLAFAAWTAANERVEALVANVAQSEEVARIERLALDAGAGAQTDYLIAEADLMRARAALAETRQAAVSARIELALIAGELSEPWLARNVETRQ
jgi:outer membrane protein TolC